MSSNLEIVGSNPRRPPWMSSLIFKALDFKEDVGVNPISSSNGVVV